MAVLKVILGLLLLVLPFFVGSVFMKKSVSVTYLYGQMLMWAVFQILAPPAINLRMTFSVLFWVYSGVVLILALLGVRNRWRVRFEKPEISLFHILALAVIGYQMGVYIFGMHLDEDDARWIAEANDALVKNRMLLHNPATGEYIGRFVGEMVKDVFSPWSMYLAWMSRMTRIRAATMAHTVYAPVLLGLCYLAYNEMGKCLFKGKAERGIFLLMVAVINLFMGGNVYTQSVFTLTRIWQGKAVVAAVMIPWILTVFLRISEEDSIQNWLSLIIAGISCCLFSGMGIAIGFLMIAVYGLYAVIRGCVKKRSEGGLKSIKRIALWVCSMMPSVVFGLAYMQIRG